MFRIASTKYNGVILFQDGLRRRMDKLKSSIEEANLAVDAEREKNVSLLHLIFPPDIAKRLWLGKLQHLCSILKCSNIFVFFFLRFSLYFPK